MENFDLWTWLYGIAAFAFGWWAGYKWGNQKQELTQHILLVNYNMQNILLSKLEAQAEYGDPKSFARKQAEIALSRMQLLQTIYKDLYGTDIRNHHTVSGRAPENDLRNNGAHRQKKRSGNGSADI